ncbi:YggT family protein [Gulosibacter macacae]|uniref:YggT family protein n=1 Tax=Gulosibacter macacae TaxID=2488791 RepID=A0A3P3VW81_9MICO|nr:YggT family protein [Gulosibacter macacae]RRJ86278.1 YggT family protein [Gulosibacter macacae]
MQLIGVVLLFAINIYTMVMWARLILDWAMVLVPSFRPKGPVLVIAELVFTLTDPPLKFLRRWVKPLRVGSIALDLAWLIVIIGLSLLSTGVRILFF